MSGESTEGLEKPEECECCQFTTADIKPYAMTRYWNKPIDERTKWLCNLCASTLAGNAFEYPEQYGREGAVMKTVCYVGNTILAEIRKGAKG